MNSIRLRRMRRILALGCCALYLVFGFVAGAAHLHESADHHAESRGLHLDHSHLGSADHDHHLGHGSSDDDDVRFDSRHVGHHGEGDVLYLTATALRSLDSNRLMPAIVSVGVTIDPSSATSDHDEALPGPPRDPPRKNPTRPRAPPA